ncbi:MAG TPA: hypothetical protein VGE62_00320 [Candidatus Paceibacterota bacterium]
MQNSSGTNTVLIVILILIVVGFGAYWYNDRQAERVEDNAPALEINI